MKIGIIGLGDMGLLYARALVATGYDVLGCDLPGRIAFLRENGIIEHISCTEDGNLVSRACDIIIYAVEAEKINEVVGLYGPATRCGAIVAGQTSVKHPEIAAFEKHLPGDVHIVTCHSLHGPAIGAKGQKLVIIPHRTSAEAYQRMSDVLSALGSELVEIPDYHVHDKIVADTQAVTHLGFESMGTAWKEAGFFPWENASYAGGIDNVKILTTLRIFGSKAHIYGGLAILNPYAASQVKQYARSESELFKLMIMEEEDEFRKRLYRARDFVFSSDDIPVLLNDRTMGEFSLAEAADVPRKPNSHLSLLSMVDAWYHLGINPYQHLICQTPPFRLRLGIAEYLFQHEELLEESIETALFNKSIRADDLEFHSAVREWTSLVVYGDMNGYKSHFDQVKFFFKDRLDHAKLKSDEMIRRLEID